MAKANVKTKQVIETVTLELNMDEYSTLVAILNRIGGSPFNSPRKHAQSIQEALMPLADWDEYGHPVNNLVIRDNFGGSIYFNDYGHKG